MSLEKICVVGVGMVGSQVADWFKDCLKYDTNPKRQFDSWEECSRADCFFVCVPSPYNGNEYDLSYLEEAIAKVPDGKVVVIKSTVSPGTTDYFQNRYPKKIFLFNPEFLTELSSKEDFTHPDMQILGVPHQGYELASKIMLMLPPAPVMRIVSLIDAEWVKKIRNSFYAMKVVFFNQMYDLVSNTIGDYETIRSIVVEDPRVGNSHSLPFHKGGRGAGGNCLPKDLNSLVGFARNKNVPLSLLEKVMEINEEYLAKFPKTHDALASFGASGVHRQAPVQEVGE